VLAFIDIDAMQKRVYGHAKQGAAFGHTKIQGKSLLMGGLNMLAATIATPIAFPPRRLPAARRERELRPWRRQLRCAIGGHRAGGGLHRDDRGADGFCILRRGGDLGDPPGGCVLFYMRVIQKQ